MGCDHWAHRTSHTVAPDHSLEVHENRHIWQEAQNWFMIGPTWEKTGSKRSFLEVFLWWTGLGVHHLLAEQPTELPGMLPSMEVATYCVDVLHGWSMSSS